jgi:hypothetical protein
VLARLTPTDRTTGILVGAAVFVLGALVVFAPSLAVAVVGLVLLIALGALPPAWLLAALLAVTTLVPYETQKAFGLSFGSGSKGLIASDLLLLVGLSRAGYELVRHRPRGRLGKGAVLVSAFVVLSGVQLLHGLVAGRDPSNVGYEFRVMAGFAAFLVAIPVLSDESERARFLRLLPALGLALGLWGLAQWMFNIQLSNAADTGVRAGVRLTTSGRGQLQGGLFAFPAALLISMAALMSHQIRSLRARLLLAAVAVLNVICLVLTYERTFWIATTIGAAYVVVKFGASERLRAFVWGTVAVVISFGLLATFAPSDLSAARERLLSLSQYGTDASVKYRTAESSNVLRQIKAHPVIGSGLGASIFWGQPWDLEPPARETFAHNGYLWLAWKLGIPAAAILYLLLAMSLGLFIRSRRGALFEAVQKGARASLLTLAIGSVTLPAYNQLSSTAALGVLMAISLAPAQLAAPPRLAMAQAAGERQG